MKACSSSLCKINILRCLEAVLDFRAWAFLLVSRRGLLQAVMSEALCCSDTELSKAAVMSISGILSVSINCGYVNFSMNASRSSL